MDHRRVVSIRDVVVRPVLDDEWKPYSELRLRALKADPLAFGSSYEREKGLGPEKWKERLRSSTVPPRSATWVAVGRAQRFVGMVTLAESESTLHVFAMWVEPRLRRKGLGGRLVDVALAWSGATAPGQPVFLEVNPRQVGAVRLYESRGFRPTGKVSSLGHTPDERVVEMVRPATVQESSP